MANNNTTLALNGYSYADGKAVFDGLELPGVTSFEFTHNQGKVNNYGFGVNPTSRSRNIKEYSGSMTMDYDTMKILESLSPTGLLSDVPTGVMVLTLENANGTTEVMTLNFFEFNGDGLSGSQGDDNLTQSVDIIFAGMSKATY